MVHGAGRESEPPPGDNPAHVVIIPIGVRCVFTIEQQIAGLHRHLSVSLQGAPGKYPNPTLVDTLLLPAFGFTGGITAMDHIWEEECSNDVRAINLLQRVEP